MKIKKCIIIIDVICKWVIIFLLIMNTTNKNNVESDVYNFRCPVCNHTLYINREDTNKITCSECGLILIFSERRYNQRNEPND